MKSRTKNLTQRGGGKRELSAVHFIRKGRETKENIMGL